MYKLVIVLIGVVAFGAMALWAINGLRSLKLGSLNQGSLNRADAGLPYLNLPNPLPNATRREPVVCLGHTDGFQAPVSGNGGLWMDSSSVVFHSAAGTLWMPRPLRFAHSTTVVAELGFTSPDLTPVLAIGFSTANGDPAIAAFRSPDATGWAIALQQ
jgi:hypothetical protein